MTPTRAALLAMIFLGWISVLPAYAVPPVATPSPGYEARLQEQRAAAARAHRPVAPVAKPARRSKRVPAN
ncbi:hypothetical protein ACO2JO_05160 [Leptospira interrogans]|jgi:hypothetical protein